MEGHGVSEAEPKLGPPDERLPVEVIDHGQGQTADGTPVHLREVRLLEPLTIGVGDVVRMDDPLNPTEMLVWRARQA